MNESLVPPRLTESDRQILTGMKEGGADRYVLLAVRDPLGFELDAADEIANHLDSAELVADSGLFRTFRGSYRGIGVTVCSTGSGAPETELALVGFAELADDDTTFIRVGTSGTANERVSVGDLVITSAAVRSDGTTAEYIDSGYPAVAHPDVTMALAEAATRLGFSHHVGITRSNDSLYAGQGRPVRGVFMPGSEGRAGRWAQANVLNFERETSLILTLCNLLGLRGGSVCSVVNSAVQKRVEAKAGTSAAIRTTLEAIVLIEERTSQRRAAGLDVWTPAIADVVANGKR